MLIEEKGINHWIDNFYGYGSWNARFWFIGHEDGGGELPEEVAEKLNYFQNVHPDNDGRLCDIRELYKHVAFRLEGPRANAFNTLFDHRFGNHPTIHGIWKNLIAFVHGYDNKKLPDLLDYQKHTLALASANNEALLSLYPLPSPHNHAWYYSWLDLPQHSFLKSRALYEGHLYKSRMNSILTRVSKYKPEVVLMYGMENINALKQSVQECYPSAKFKMGKATKLLIPGHHRAELDGTLLILTTQIPALRHNRVESGFDWEEFGKRLKAGNL